MTSAAAKADVIKDEYEEATQKVENIKVGWWEIYDNTIINVLLIQGPNEHTLWTTNTLSDFFSVFWLNMRIDITHNSLVDTYAQ